MYYFLNVIQELNITTAKMTKLSIKGSNKIIQEMEL